jgi:hypothetical protein
MCVDYRLKQCFVSFNLCFIQSSLLIDVPVLGKSATQSAQTTYPAVNAIDGDIHTFSLTGKKARRAYRKY